MIKEINLIIHKSNGGIKYSKGGQYMYQEVLDRYDRLIIKPTKNITELDLEKIKKKWAHKELLITR
jgi:hypothetical protein